MHSAVIDPLAVVHPSAKLGRNVSVGPFSIIGANVEIGDDSRIDSHVVIKGPSKIGCNNQFFAFCTVGEATPDLTYRGEPTTLTMGDDNVIREGATIHRGTIKGRGDTLIGNNNLIMPYVHIGHDSIVGNHCILVNNAALAGHVVLGDHVILSGYTLVHQYCQLGPHCFTGMGTAVGKDIPAFVLVTGSPAEARSINQEGLRRRGFSKEDISALNAAYKTVYRRGLTLEEALAQLKPIAQGNQHVSTFVESLLTSTRGIVR